MSEFKHIVRTNTSRRIANLQSLVTTYVLSKTSMASSASADGQISFMTSNKGQRLLVLNEHVYRWIKKTAGKKYWICMISGCSITVHTNEDDIYVGWSKTSRNCPRSSPSHAVRSFLFFIWVITPFAYGFMEPKTYCRRLMKFCWIFFESRIFGPIMFSFDGSSWQGPAFARR